MEFYNYIVPRLSSQLDVGHIKAADLLGKILNHNGSEAYHSYFDLEQRDNYKGYQGIHKPAMGWFAIDFDAPEVLDANKKVMGYDINVARLEVLKAWRHLGLTEFFAIIFFTGAKGFHLYVREEFFAIPHTAHTAADYATLMSKLKTDFKLSTLDDSIIQATRKFRLPGSQHQKTGLFKCYLTLEQLQSLSIDEIKEYAKTPGECFMEHDPNFTERFVASAMTSPQSGIRAGAVPSAANQTEGPGAFGHENISADDVQDGSLFREFKGKVCIQKMYNADLHTGQRHGVAGVLIAEYYQTGVPLAEAHSRIEAWAKLQGVHERYESEFVRMIEQQYDGQAQYNYSCYNVLKKEFCSGTCELYPKLDKAQRAVVSDIPPKVQKILDEQDKPSERKLAQEIIDSFQGRIVKQDKDIFFYKETHWVEASQREIDGLKEMIFSKLGRRAKSKDMTSAYATLVHGIPAVPANVNMFQPNPDAANFLNGTLWVVRAKGEYTLKWKLHDQEDYLTNCLGVSYSPNQTGAINTRFQDLLDHYLEGDPERAEKLRMMKQVAAAMIMPKFPQIFFFLGDSGTGKSTFVKLFYRLIGGAEVSGFVQPCDMHNFQLEGLIHKTINIHTDVNEWKPIPDEFFKSSGDRIPMQINRKGKKVVQSYLPAVHVFCANTLPPTQVKNQNVYDRRMTIIKLDNVVKSRVDQYEDLVFEEDTQALVEFAMEGLRDIIGLGGFYSKAESSKAMTKAWQEMSADPIQDFIDDIKHNDVAGVSLEEAGSVNRNVLFSAFDKWCIDFGLRQAAVSRGKFYRELGARGFRLKMVKGERQIQGFKTLESGSSSAPQAASF